MLDKFIADVGGVTRAAALLHVSSAIIHRWQKTAPSTRATLRINAWLTYTLPHARFILQGVWAYEDGFWSADPAEYRDWCQREFRLLVERHGTPAWALDLWSLTRCPADE